MRYLHESDPPLGSAEVGCGRKESDSYQSDCWSNGQRSDEFEHETDETTKANDNLEQ